MSRQLPDGSWPQESIEGGASLSLLSPLPSHRPLSPPPLSEVPTDGERPGDARARDSVQQERGHLVPQLQVCVDNQRPRAGLEEAAPRGVVEPDGAVVGAAVQSQGRLAGRRRVGSMMPACVRGRMRTAREARARLHARTFTSCSRRRGGRRRGWALESRDSDSLQVERFHLARKQRVGACSPSIHRPRSTREPRPPPCPLPLTPLALVQSTHNACHRRICQPPPGRHPVPLWSVLPPPVDFPSSVLPQLRACEAAPVFSSAGGARRVDDNAAVCARPGRATCSCATWALPQEEDGRRAARRELALCALQLVAVGARRCLRSLCGHDAAREAATGRSVGRLADLSSSPLSLPLANRRCRRHPLARSPRPSFSCFRRTPAPS